MGNLTRCNGCTARIEFFRSPFTGEPRAFEVRPIDGHHALAIKAYPVLSGRAYKFADLVDVIQVQRQCSRDDAEAEVRDMPWHVLHDCPNKPDTTDSAPVERTPN